MVTVTQRPLWPSMSNDSHHKEEKVILPARLIPTPHLLLHSTECRRYFLHSPGILCCLIYNSFKYKSPSLVLNSFKMIKYNCHIFQSLSSKFSIIQSLRLLNPFYFLGHFLCPSLLQNFILLNCSCVDLDSYLANVLSRNLLFNP